MTADEHDWKGALYFGPPDIEVYFCEEPDEAARLEFDAYLNSDMSDEDIHKLADDMEIEIVGMRPKAVAFGDIRRAADLAMDSIADALSDEYGNIVDGETFPEDSEYAAIERSLVATLTRVLRHARPWQCVAVSSYTYTGQELANLVLL